MKLKKTHLAVLAVLLILAIIFALCILNQTTPLRSGFAGFMQDPVQWVRESMFGPDHEFGGIVDGKFVETDELLVWLVRSRDDLIGVDPSIHLYAQVVRDLEDFSGEPPKEIAARIQGFHDDDRPASRGVWVKMRLIRDGSSIIYRTVTPFILIDNPKFEGEHNGLIAVTGADGHVELQFP